MSWNLILLLFGISVMVVGYGDDETTRAPQAQVLKFDDGATLEGKQMRPSIELVVDPGEVFGSAVFIETVDIGKVAEKGISEALLEEIK